MRMNRGGNLKTYNYEEVPASFQQGHTSPYVKRRRRGQNVQKKRRSQFLM